jgi:hypothetical protein
MTMKIYEELRHQGGSIWRELKPVKASAEDLLRLPSSPGRQVGLFGVGLAHIIADAAGWAYLAGCCVIATTGVVLFEPWALIEPATDWSDQPPPSGLHQGVEAGSILWAGLARAAAHTIASDEELWFTRAAALDADKKNGREWEQAAALGFELWREALTSDAWPASPSAALAPEDGLCALDRAVLKLLRDAQGCEDAQPFIDRWRTQRGEALVKGLGEHEHWRAWLPLRERNLDKPASFFADSLYKGDHPLAWGYDCPRVVDVVLHVVKAARSQMLMARAPTVASNTLTNLRRGLSPHARAEQRGPRAWELLDAVGNKVAHAEGLDGGHLALLPAGALLRLVKSGNEVLRSPTGIRLILGICALARQRAAGLSNASPHLNFNGLEDLVRQCGLPVNKRTIAAAREVVAAGHVWHWADEWGGAAGLWTYTYHDDTGGTNGGRISRLTIVPGAPLIPARGERGVLLAALPMLGSLGAPRLVGGEAQLHLALCAEIQTASASLREGIGLVCEGETLERLARESGLKVDQVRAAIERWILEGVLSREGNGGVLWGEARSEARIFIIDQGEHRRAKSEGGKASAQKRRGGKR